MIDEQQQNIQNIEEECAYEAKVKRTGILSDLCLREENVRYSGTAGVSENNREEGFRPAFQDLRNGCCLLSRFADGRPAPIHLLDGLPNAWIASWDASGQAETTRAWIVSGFYRDGTFYSRDQVSRLLQGQIDPIS